MKGKIFNAQEVQAILKGSKVMFREVIKKPSYTSIGGTHVSSRYIQGSEIFVKEVFEIWDDGIVYRASNPACDPVAKWKPAQHMKQEHSRISLLIKEIKVERLASISEEDAIKEGATSRPNCHGYANIYDGWSMDWSKVGEASKWASNEKTVSESDVCMGSAQYAFGNYWNATHKKPEEKFEASPWVWVISFEVMK